MSRKLKPFNNRTFSLYLNFNVKTNKKSRSASLNHFKKIFGKDKTAFFATKSYKWSEYLQQLGDTQFVISPPGKNRFFYNYISIKNLGNGIDCHRTWEALIMGAIPIVLRSELQPLYDDMPVMVVDNWEEVTQKALSEFKTSKLNLSINRVPRRKKIWIRYWIDEIENTRTKLKQSFCSKNQR